MNHVQQWLNFITSNVYQAFVAYYSLALCDAFFYSFFFSRCIQFHANNMLCSINENFDYTVELAYE